MKLGAGGGATGPRSAADFVFKATTRLVHKIQCICPIFSTQIAELDITIKNSRSGSMAKFLPRPVRRSEGERRALADREERKLQLRLRDNCEQGKHHLLTPPHTHHNCPYLPCNRCKRAGHIAPNCPQTSRALQTNDSIPQINRSQVTPDLGSASLLSNPETASSSNRSWSVPQTYQAIGLSITELKALGADIVYLKIRDCFLVKANLL